MDDNRPNLDALLGQELVALHVASNQIELIFSDGSGDNDEICLYGDFATHSADGGRLEWSVPRGADALTACLDRRVTQARYDASRNIELQFEGGQAVTISDEPNVPWLEIVRIGEWPPK